MITLYGKTYGPAGDNGTFRLNSEGVYLSDLTGRERVFIRRDGLGPVSVGRNSAGARFYMHATSTMDEKWLGTPDSFAAEIDGAKSVARELFANG